MSAELVHIEMITYNHESYIRQAIESVLMQKTSFKYRLIIGEDCSTDLTASIVREYAEKYPEKITAIINEKNLGWVENIKQVRDVITAKYVAMLEGDDYWTDPLKLQKQVDLIEKTNADCCNTLWKELTNDGEIKSCGNKEEGTEYIIPKKGNFYYHHASTRLFRSTALFRVLEYFPMNILSDTPLQIIFSEYFKVVNLMEYSSVYRISGSGVWSSLDGKAKDKQHVDLYHNLAIWIPKKRRKFLKMKWRLKLQNLKLPKFLVEKGTAVFSKLNHHSINYCYGHIEFDPNK
jgi:glycosyltransferase involved in cell wall biosynthesis